MIIDQVYNNIKANQKSTGKSERHSRSIVKAISWRTLGTLDTVLISWFISGNLSIAFSIGTFELLTKTLLYYFHERLWNGIKWGNK
ncbi:DUF2061 domain-containing protein [Brumimicrobium glaciale]|jgi:uncharacterized membrane protein|uniref:DUF2061 domain-containing protein n=1 Tax=Brumimicrobium glaciale TaxID=200475 RepID=A0A4Q4KRC1_9FLAO|nr:DUF2061 domain-containing protein [Brumimicrobium glaciale]RYM35813.1 DUF2061 domain-containing protein [Brumimicrobium glaciale]